MPHAPHQPAQRHRLEKTRDNLQARIAEAEREGWTGEAEGLKVSLDAANNKIESPWVSFLKFCGAGGSWRG
jgi:hypothetical protein